MNWLGKEIRTIYATVPGFDYSDSFLDLGCGLLQATDALGPRHIGVDVYKPYLEQLKGKIIVMKGKLPYVCRQFINNSFDHVLLLDVVEHLTKDTALACLQHADRIARKTVIVFTTDGFVRQDAHDKHGCGLNPYQEHKCGFSSGELVGFGFAVTRYGNCNWTGLKFGALLGVKRQ